MRHLARRLRTLVCVLSLLLSVAAAAWWARSYSTTDRLPRLVEAGQYQLLSTRGRMILLNMRPLFSRPGQLIDAQVLAVGDRTFPLAGGVDKAMRAQIVEERGRISYRILTVRTDPAVPANGFGFDFMAWTPGGGWQLVVPHWAVVAVGLLLPVAVLGRRAARRRRQRRPGEPGAGTGEPGPPVDRPAPAP